MLTKTRYYLRLVPRDENNPKQFIELYCSKWIAQRAFVSLAYGMWRNGLYRSLDLCTREYNGKEKIHKTCTCNMEGFKYLVGHDGGKL